MLWSRLSGSRFERSAQWLSIAQSATGVERNKLLEIAAELAGYVPEDHWNIAVAMRRGDDELKRHVDEALQKLMDDKVVARALADYQVPYFPPFDAAAKVAGGHRPTGWSRVPSSGY
jgi:hypothetical protein